MDGVEENSELRKLIGVKIKLSNKTTVVLRGVFSQC